MTHTDKPDLADMKPTEQQVSKQIWIWKIIERLLREKLKALGETDPQVFHDLQKIDLEEFINNARPIYTMALYVARNAELESQLNQADLTAEETECAHMVLDDVGAPRKDEGNVYSLVGRIKTANRKAKADGYREAAELCGNDDYFPDHDRWFLEHRLTEQADKIEKGQS